MFYKRQNHLWGVTTTLHHKYERLLLSTHSPQRHCIVIQFYKYSFKGVQNTKTKFLNLKDSSILRKIM